MSYPLRAVVFDWAGTMVDFGCLAPVEALIEAFAGDGVTLTDAEARADMGKGKREHVAAIFAAPAVADRWAAANGRPAAPADEEALYRRLEPLMVAAAERCAALIPGAAETCAALLAKGVRIGSGTGYTREMMAAIVPAAAAQGYAPEVVVCSDDVPEGRPAPFMTWRALTELRVFPPSLCVKVDDAPVGVLEGRNAGCWTIGVAASGNGVGLSAAALEALPGPERARRVGAAAAVLKGAGADLVVETARDLEAALDLVAGWIAEGRVPAPPSPKEGAP